MPRPPRPPIICYDLRTTNARPKPPQRVHSSPKRRPVFLATSVPVAPEVVKPKVVKSKVVKPKGQQVRAEAVVYPREIKRESVLEVSAMEFFDKVEDKTMLEVNELFHKIQKLEEEIKEINATVKL